MHYIGSNHLIACDEHLRHVQCQVTGIIISIEVQELKTKLDFIGLLRQWILTKNIFAFFICFFLLIQSSSILPCSVASPRMSSKLHPSNNIAHARRTVNQLRIEASIERIKVECLIQATSPVLCYVSFPPTTYGPGVLALGGCNVLFTYDFSLYK